MDGPLNDVNLDLVDSIDKAWEFKRWLGERRAGEVLAIDTESAGLAIWRDRMRLVQFGDMKTGWAVPWDRWGGVAEEALNSYTDETTYHNSKYDVGVLQQWSGWKADWSRIHDTMALAHLDDPTRTKGLKRLAAMLIDPRAASSQTVMDVEMTKNNWDWGTVPITREGVGSSYWIYGALDPVLTAHLYDRFRDTRLAHARSYDLELGVLRSICDMETHGALVDIEYSEKMIGVIAEYSGQVRAWARENHGIENATSVPQCIRRFEELDRKITTFTDKGAPSLDKEQLEKFLIGEDYDRDVEEWELDSLPGNDLAKALLSLRKGEKMSSTYFQKFIRSVDPNGRVHATIWPTGARTARMSITEPGLQTLPRRDPIVRNAFVPAPGHVLITIDADQIELRLFAHFSRDEGLKRAFIEEADFFNTVASDAWGDTITKKDPRRQTFKNATYAKGYGASIPKIAITAGVPIHVIERVMARFDQNYPGIAKVQQECIRLGRQRGSNGNRPYVITPYGRYMYGDRGEEHKLTNYLIQSSAAEVLKQGICDLQAVGLGEYVLLPVHDELVLEVPVEDAEEVKVTLEETLNAVGRDYFVPLTWSADIIQERWGEKYG